ncbi:MAG: bifunctional DNA primase/polymerase [Candidatus Dormibacteria bacterium]
MQDHPTLREAALGYAARGWLVFPCHGMASDGHCTCGKRGCRTPGKHPRPVRWLLEATTAADTVRGWWRRWPDSNIGVVTGRRSGLLVIDVDPRHGGDDALAALEQENDQLPETVEAVTGSGGRHILFAYPSQHVIRNSASLVGLGIDVRGEGGYIVAAPSGHVSGRGYAWEAAHHPTDVALAPPPAWLLALLAAGRNGRHPAPPLEESIPEGRRSASMVSLAGSMRRRGANADSILAALRIENAARCHPPLDDDELRSIARSVSGYARGSRAQPVSIRTAPTPGTVDRKSDGFTLTRLGDLLDEPEERVTWLVPDIMPMGGLIFVAAKPKVGKSTLVRNLALAVAQGSDFLGRRCTQGTVIYLALEERRSEVRRHFRQMGGRPEDPLFVHVARAPANGLAALIPLIRTHAPILVVIDPLLRFTRVKDEKAYAELSNALEGVMAAAREHNVCIVATHHAPKASGTEAIDALLGSTALSGAPDTVLVIRRQDQARTVETVQRYGSDLEKTVLTLDPEAGTVRLAGTVAEARRQEDRRRVLAALEAGTELTRDELVSCPRDS